ncbi:hypothetical protein DPV78_001947 [Talaromyces pinophilus]|nr:hypothetical protein DPV78_001947 [Talaromyces pinophilus]
MSSTIGKDAFKSLYDIFANRKSEEVLEIEILSPESGPLLQDGLCLGITKAALVKAFLVARQKFLDYLVHPSRSKAITLTDGINEFDIATQIILLFDCEHVTACNWRKRYISSSLQEYVNRDDSGSLEDLLQGERTLMTSFQCSPLHRHTKSPTLWQHRLWIMTKSLTLRESNVVDSETSKDSLRQLILEELDVVCKSGQLHPRNYYAFSYMRQLHALVCQFSKSDSQAMRTELAVAMIEPLLKWCLSNPSDISGWMYLFYLLNCDSDILEDGLFEERKLVIERTIHFAIHIATWEGESLWTFVDLMIARFGVNILPTVGVTTTEQWDSSSASGACWKTTKLRAFEIYKGIQDQAIS